MKRKPDTQSIPGDLIEKLRNAQSITAMTGAGVSAESGIPTFRDAQTGLWARFRPEELATPQAFQRNPRLVWEWYTWRRSIINKAQPNPGHLALAKMEEFVPNFTLITQNVDGLHLRAGSRRVIELHGNIHRVKCSMDGLLAAGWDDRQEKPPRCPVCGSLLRPDVVWFGEMLPADAFCLARQASAGCQVFLAIGTSGVVEPAASLARLALEQGAILVEINPTDTPLTSLSGFVLRGLSGEILPALVEAVWQRL